MYQHSKIIFVLPIISERLWQIYNVKGFQFKDIPRHFYIHSKKSFEYLMNKKGFKIINSKSFFEDKVIKDVHGNCEVESKKNLKKDILSKQDTGLICFLC